jgi:hypothetical protein
LRSYFAAERESHVGNLGRNYCRVHVTNLNTDEVKNRMEESVLTRKSSVFVECIEVKVRLLIY